MEWIDTHCHLDFSEFDEYRAGLIRKCTDDGFSALIIPGVDIDNSYRILDMVGEDALLYAAPGLHPCYCSVHRPDHLDQLAALLERNRVVAMGEIGLDLYHSDIDIDRQYMFFETQLDMAEAFNLPVILHVRKAHDKVTAILKRRSGRLHGVVHAFSGSAQQADNYLANGFLLGIGGVVTHERARKIRSVVAGIPDEAYVLETDAPDMSPAFAQGVANSPLNLPAIAECVASLRGQAVEDVARVSTANARQLFGLQEIL